MEIIQSILLVIISAGLTGGITWYFSDKIAKSNESIHLRNLNHSFDEIKVKHDKANEILKQKENELAIKSKIAEKYVKVKKELENSSVVQTFYQPVILVGPRGSGKTSLLMQWHAPWSKDRLEPNKGSSVSNVPIYDFKADYRIPHFADPDIKSPLYKHLLLKVHDFPGEILAQEEICQVVKDETIKINEETGKDLGIVLICMLNAEEVIGSISSETKDYYNGELFKKLRLLVTHGNISIARLIFVFNKYDLLKKHYNNKNDDELLTLCVDKYSSIFNGLFHGVVNTEKMCEVFTILSREDMFNKNRGANIVLGEAARNFVKEIAGEAALKKIVEQTATNRLSKKI